MSTTPARRGWVIGGVVAVLAVAVVIAVVAGGGSDSDDSGSSVSGGTSTAKQQTAPVTVDGTPLPAYQADGADKAVGLQAPTLVGEGFDAEPVTIGPTGTPRVVMFLAHWCPHCQDEVPRIVTLAKQGAFDGLDVAAVATGTSADALNYPPSAWLAREHWPFTVMVDDQRGTAAQAFGLSAYPFFTFLDGSGKVLGRATGEIEPAQLDKILDALPRRRRAPVRVVGLVELVGLSDATERFAALVHQPPDHVPLDRAVLLIAAHAHPEVDVVARLGELDRLAEQVPATPSAAGVAEALFGPGGFTGNTVDYYDPANSYFDDVLDRRLGIPITLSVLMIEVARRVGVGLVGVGMPGHFLVGVPASGGDDSMASGGIGRWYDPFHGPEPLDADDCSALFARVQGTAPGGPLVPREHLSGVGTLAILDRILANLQQTLLQRSPAAAAWPTRLRLSFPEVPPGRRAELAVTLGSLGRFSEAASALDALAAELGPEEARRATQAASELRARAN